MTQNLITSAFELVRDVEQGVLLLDTFHRLATREVLPPRPSHCSPAFSACFPCASSSPNSIHALTHVLCSPCFWIAREWPPWAAEDLV